MTGIVILGAFITAAVACCYVIKVAFSSQQHNDMDIDEKLQNEARWLEYKERREMEERQEK